MPSDLSSSLERTERKTVRRKRDQQGSLQVKKHGKNKMWVLQYREGGARRYHTLGPFSKMTKSEAQRRQTRIMSEVNARSAFAPDPNITIGAFLDGVALPFYRSKWKRSTALTTESRMSHHLAGVSRHDLAGNDYEDSPGLPPSKGRRVVTQRRNASSLGSAIGLQTRSCGRIRAS